MAGAASGLILLLLSACLVFWVPLKNLVVHGNPIYPLELKVGGVTLNHTERLSRPERASQAAPGVEGREPMSRLERWAYSVFEIGMGPVRSLDRWGLEGSCPPSAPLFPRQGGFFGHYVVMLLALLVTLLAGGDRRLRVAVTALVLTLTALAILLPNNNFLRYYQFWMLCLVAVTLFLIEEVSRGRWTGQWWLRPAVGVVLLGVVLVVVDATDQNFIHPRFHSLEDLLAERVRPGVVGQIPEGGKVCLVGEIPPRVFPYAAIFHPPREYALKAPPYGALTLAEVGDGCGDWPPLVLDPYRPRRGAGGVQ
jgi:hypothetical protein